MLFLQVGLAAGRGLPVNGFIIVHEQQFPALIPFAGELLLLFVKLCCLACQGQPFFLQLFCLAAERPDFFLVGPAQHITAPILQAGAIVFFMAPVAGFDLPLQGQCPGGPLKILQRLTALIGKTARQFMLEPVIQRGIRLDLQFVEEQVRIRITVQGMFRVLNPEIDQSSPQVGLVHIAADPGVQLPVHQQGQAEVVEHPFNGAFPGLLVFIHLQQLSGKGQRGCINGKHFGHSGANGQGTGGDIGSSFFQGGDFPFKFLVLLIKIADGHAEIHPLQVKFVQILLQPGQEVCSLGMQLSEPVMICYGRKLQGLGKMINPLKPLAGTLYFAVQPFDLPAQFFKPSTAMVVNGRPQIVFVVAQGLDFSGELFPPAVQPVNGAVQPFNAGVQQLDAKGLKIGG